MAKKTIWNERNIRAVGVAVASVVASIATLIITVSAAWCG
jgi:hypothetical protein